MRVVFLLVSSLLPISNTEAAFENRALSVRAEGMGGAFTAIGDNDGVIFYNPAGLAQITLQEISFLHTHLFNLSELKQNLINFVQPIKEGGMGFSYQQFAACDNYKEEILTFGISTFASKNLCIGINLKQLCLEIDGYGQTTGLGIDVGGLYEISPKVTIGFAGFNLNNPLIDVERNYNLGLSIRPKENLLIAIDIEKSARFNSEIKIGQEFWVTNNICIRAGLKKHTTTQPTLGLGILINLIQFDHSCTFHTALEQTHRFSLTKWF